MLIKWHFQSRNKNRSHLFHLKIFILINLNICAVVLPYFNNIVAYRKVWRQRKICFDSISELHIDNHWHLIHNYVSELWHITIFLSTNLHWLSTQCAVSIQHVTQCFGCLVRLVLFRNDLEIYACFFGGRINRFAPVFFIDLQIQSSFHDLDFNMSDVISFIFVLMVMNVYYICILKLILHPNFHDNHDKQPCKVSHCIEF